MRVLISDDSTTSFAEVEELKALSVDLLGIDPGRADEILRRGGLGWIEGDHAWLSVDALREGHPGGSASWIGEFDAMIHFAAEHGWVDEDGLMVRAHIEGSQT